MVYQEMSDLEINTLVAKALRLEISFLPFGISEARRRRVRLADGSAFDPCNSWADAGPIIQENRIGIREYDGWWEARSFAPEYAYCQQNPLRAAMIVFLMMKESDNG